MKKARVVVVGALCLAMLGAAGQSANAAAGGYMGIILDPSPLPPLLIRHLRLSPGEGLRVANVQADSPADKAGLERDDIIIELADKQVQGAEAFVNEVRSAGAGAEISIKIIQSGRRKTVSLVLGNADQVSAGAPWKYAAEPEPIESWQPGRMWFMEPGDKDWSEVPWRELLKTPGGLRDVTRLFKELYTFRHQEDGQSYTITIEGDPSDEEAWILVRTTDTEYKVTARDIDELPEQYRQSARDSLQRAQEQKAQRPDAFKLPSVPRMPSLRREDIFESLKNVRPPTIEREDIDKVVEKIQNQMRQLQKEIEKLQKEQKHIFERFREAPEGNDASGA
jgi:hypothetical protein